MDHEYSIYFKEFTFTIDIKFSITDKTIGKMTFSQTCKKDDNVHRQGVGPSVYDTNKEHVKEMKRAQEIYNWD